MGKRYFGTDGIRGQVGTPPITAEFMLKLGWAVGRVLASSGSKKVLIGKDTRISGYMFESAIEAGLSAAGVDIALLGVMPTPGIAYLTRTLRASSGIVISASHNPYYDNGIKFFSDQGLKLPDALEHDIEALLEEPLTTVDGNSLGKAERVVDARGRYIEFCKSTISSHFSLAGLKIVVDCANGATYHIAPEVFDELGATVIAIGNKPDGLNINQDCGAVSTDALSQAVLKQQADIGIAFDGDGDRVMMVDHQGRMLDGDELLFIIAKDRLENYPGSAPPTSVVGTLMSNLGLEIGLKNLGIELQRVKVGDRYILERLLADDLLLGGESSGHIICRDRTTTGDGIVAALQVLAALIRTEQSLSALTSGMEKYPQAMINVPVRDSIDLEHPVITQAVNDIENQLGENGRVLLRPSGTEPVIRVMVEGADRRQVDMLTNDLAGAVTNAIGN